MPTLTSTYLTKKKEHSLTMNSNAIYRYIYWKYLFVILCVGVHVTKIGTETDFIP